MATHWPVTLRHAAGSHGLGHSVLGLSSGWYQGPQRNHHMLRTPERLQVLLQLGTRPPQVPTSVSTCWSAGCRPTGPSQSFRDPSGSVPGDNEVPRVPRQAPPISLAGDTDSFAPSGAVTRLLFSVMPPMPQGQEPASMVPLVAGSCKPPTCMLLCE
ncbi:hypothetical protein EYF80_042752 [Liparis tanakae]|uniref:Uncharacterized protein n=1 Tax=Liparis tanakae TaxID=230148 RepID=A0A4Z2G0I4_9TELE|nr:hypothetical protein EYF80_042752 [Liparis tanakae]